jgi:hypothetical protein
MTLRDHSWRARACQITDLLAGLGGRHALAR